MSRGRQIVGRVLRRVPAINTRILQRRERQREVDDLTRLYGELRRTYAPRRPAGRPTTIDVTEVGRRAVAAKVYATFFETVTREGDFRAAMVDLTRALLRQPGGDSARARTLATVCRDIDGLRGVSDICLALCALAEPMPDAAWTLFGRQNLADALRWAAEEYLGLAFRRDPAVAGAALRLLLEGGLTSDAGPHAWLAIAYHAFSAGDLDAARGALARATVGGMSGDGAQGRQLRARHRALGEWIERASQQRTVPRGDSALAFAVVGFDHPDWTARTTDVVDYMESLAVLGHLVRRADVRLDAPPTLAGAVDEFSSRALPGRPRELPVRTVTLYEVDRDLSRYASVPDGTWIVVSEWFAHPLAGWRVDMPLDSRFCPIFISFHITPRELREPGVIEYLRRHGPIGCREWDTVFLLLAAEVPAYFSGTVVSTLDLVVVPSHAPPPSVRTFVDCPADAPGEQGTRLIEQLRDGSLGDGLSEAAAALTRLQQRTVVTRDARLFVALRSVGCPAELRVSDAGDYRVRDFASLTDDAVRAMGRSITATLDVVLDAILGDAPAEEVYRRLAAHCHDQVTDAQRRLHGARSELQLGFDLDAACARIRAGSAVRACTEPLGAGAEINVEFSLDENYLHQLEIVLDSVVQRSSRPVRAFVLCRGLSLGDLDRLARAFPMVSFEWLPTDDVDYGIDFGRLGSRNKWTSVATMDRTILPILLPDVDRIIHFDLDALCLHDLAELFDVEMAGAAIAGADEPQPKFSEGFEIFRRNVARLRRSGLDELGDDLLLRMYSTHDADFTIFNAGIAVLDLAKMRSDDFCGRFLPYVGRYGVNDQILFNMYVGGRRARLDPDWNRLVRVEVADAPKVAHWAGPLKPWNSVVADRHLWEAQEQHFRSRLDLPAEA